MITYESMLGWTLLARKQHNHVSAALTLPGMVCCRLSKQQMSAISDVDLMEQCKCILPSQSHVTPPPVKTHATAVSQPPADTPRSAAATLASPQDDAATVPIGDAELSPRLRSFIADKRNATPASREALEAWRAGQADVIPSASAAGGQHNINPSDSILPVTVPPSPEIHTPAAQDQQTDVSAAAHDAPPANASVAASGLAALASQNGASTQGVASQTVSRRPKTLLEALLIGRP